MRVFPMSQYLGFDFNVSFATMDNGGNRSVPPTMDTYSTSAAVYSPQAVVLQHNKVRPHGISEYLSNCARRFHVPSWDVGGQAL